MKNKLLKTVSLMLVAALSLVFLASCDNDGKVKNLNDLTSMYESNKFTTLTKVEGSNAAQVGFKNLTSAAIVENKITAPDTALATLKAKIYTVEISVRNFGTMTLELYEALAPKSVNNFVNYAKSGFYDGLIFHRIIDGFMIQGGDPTGTGYGDSSLEKIYGEFESNGWSRNMNLKFEEGVIGMARSNDPNSGSSQFFICLDDYDYGNGEYASFGKMTDGFDVLHAIGKVKVGGAQNSTPVEAVIIDSIKVTGEVEEVLDSSLTENVVSVRKEYAYVFVFEDEDSAISNFAQVEMYYQGNAGVVYTSDFEVKRSSNVIVAGTEKALELFLSEQ